MRPPALQVGVPGGIEILIYRDAKQQGSHHALAWGVGAFFGSLVVWILYVVVRDEVCPGGPPQSENPPRYDSTSQSGEPPQSGGPRQ